MTELSSWALLLAQASPAGPDAISIQSIWDFVVKGGVLMIPLGITSLVALTVIIERSVSLKRSKVIPPAFLTGIDAALKQPNPRVAAMEHCRRSDSPIARVLAAALRRADEPLEVLERHVEDAGQREVARLKKYFRVLSLSVAISPLMGLLGTVFGMIKAFQTVAASAESLGRAETLARGIYEAMITTAAGLIIAIPTLIAYHWLSARVDRLVNDMDELTVDFVEDHIRTRRVLSGAPSNGAVAHAPPRPEPVVAAAAEEIQLADTNSAPQPALASR